MNYIITGVEFIIIIIIIIIIITFIIIIIIIIFLVKKIYNFINIFHTNCYLHVTSI